MLHEELSYLTSMIRSRCGIALTADKAYLIESRLMPVARAEKLDSISALVAKLRSSTNEQLVDSVIDAITINESFFFRDSRPFELFKTVMIPELMKRRQASRKIRIWSAASSTGQEPYSLAMCLEEILDKTQGWHIEIVATDICRTALERAETGCFSQFEVQRGLATALLLKYFTKQNGEWAAKENIRKNIHFRRHNLLDINTNLGIFDIIFARNVLMYFDLPTKRRVINGLAQATADDGYIVLGGTETCFGVTDRLHVDPGNRILLRPKTCT